MREEISRVSEEVASMILPKQTASGTTPLTFTAHLAAPAETWAVYGKSGGVGVDRSGTITIAVSVNGTENVAVGIPQKLYYGDYIKRTEGGAGVLHLANDASGNPRQNPVETSITIPCIILGKGSQTVTVAGTVQPSKVEIVYR